MFENILIFIWHLATVIGAFIGAAFALVALFFLFLLALNSICRRATEYIGKEK